MAKRVKTSLAIFIGNLPSGTEVADVLDLCEREGLKVHRKSDGSEEVNLQGNKAMVVLDAVEGLSSVLTKSGEVILGGRRLTFSTADTAREVVANIRASWGIDVAVDEKVQQILQKYRASLSESLRLLSEELYSTSTHFLLELLQNADDNNYQSEVTPTFEIRLDIQAPLLQVVNNEVGFSEANVYAICDSGQSTKARKVGFIGEKGIGFKSVFAVSSSPMIVSNEYRFQFKLNPEDPMGYVVPHWVDEVPVFVEPHTTNIILPLKSKVLPSVKQTLQSIEHPILLFLKNIRILKVSFVQGFCIVMTRKDGDDGLVEIVREIRNERATSSKPSSTATTAAPSSQNVTTQLYKKVEKELPLTPALLKERGYNNVATQTRITLAFPIGAVRPQLLFAFLPVREYGFKFVIQADFKLSTTRADIPASEWNMWLRDNIPDVFEMAVAHFLGSLNFRTSFYELVPLLEEVPDPFFHSVVTKIQQKLAAMNCVLTQTNQWLPPGRVFFAPPPELTNLVPNEDILAVFGMEFLSPDIALTSRTTIGVLRTLGVQRFAPENLINLIEHPRFAPILKTKPLQWHTDLYGCLAHYITRREIQAQRLQNISFLLLQTGKLIAPSGHPLYLQETNKPPPITSGDDDDKEGGAEASANQPRPAHHSAIDDELPILHRHFSGMPAPQLLFRLLGISAAHPQTIILQHLLPRMRSMNPERLVAVTRYIKDHEAIVACEMLSDKGLLLLSVQNQLFKPADMLLPTPYNSFPVQEVVQDRLPFVSPAYLPDDANADTIMQWRVFLLRLGCHLLFPILRSPKGGGYFCHVLSKIVDPPGLAPPLLLQMRLRLCQAMTALWDHIYPYTLGKNAFWTGICNLRWLPGSDGNYHRPCDGKLFLRTKCTLELLRDSVVYLQAEMGVLCAKALGVKTEVTPEIVLERLPSLKCATDILVELYAFLQTQWSICGARIMDAFKKTKMIHCAGKTYGITDLCWSGDPLLLRKTPILGSVYPQLKSFFVDCLEVPSKPTLAHYISELDVYRSLPQGQLAVHKPIISSIYFYINRCILIDEPTEDQVQPLLNEPLFLSNKDTWRKCKDLIINDGPQQNAFAAQQDATKLLFWDIPTNCLPKVQAITLLCEIPQLSTLQPVGGGPDMNTLQHSATLTAQVRGLVPFLLRYAYFENYEHYVRLVNPWKYFRINVWTSAKLTASYQVNDYAWDSDLEYFLKDEAEECHVFVGTVRPERSLPKALGECFGASPLTIQGMLAAHNTDALNQMLTELGVGMMPDTEMQNLKPPTEEEIPLPQIPGREGQPATDAGAAAAAALASGALGAETTMETDAPASASGNPVLGQQIQQQLLSAAIWQGHQHLRQEIQNKQEQTIREQRQAKRLQQLQELQRQQQVVQEQLKQQKEQWLRQLEAQQAQAEAQRLIALRRQQHEDGESDGEEEDDDAPAEGGEAGAAAGADGPLGPTGLPMLTAAGSFQRDLVALELDHVAGSAKLPAPTEEELAAAQAEQAAGSSGDTGDDDDDDDSDDEYEGRAAKRRRVFASVETAPLVPIQSLNAALAASVSAHDAAVPLVGGRQPAFMGGTGSAGLVPLTEEQTRALQSWGEHYIFRHLQHEKKQQLQWLNPREDAGLPYDITYIASGKITYVEIVTTLDAEPPDITMGPSQWRWALRHRAQYHVYVITGACSDDVAVSLLVDPVGSVWEGHLPCTVAFRVPEVAPLPPPPPAPIESAQVAAAQPLPPATGAATIPAPAPAAVATSAPAPAPVPAPPPAPPKEKETSSKK